MPLSVLLSLTRFRQGARGILSSRSMGNVIKLSSDQSQPNHPCLIVRK